MTALYCWIVMLCLQTYMLSVTSLEDGMEVSATEGGNMTLRLPGSGAIGFKKIMWVRAGGHHFATATPDGKVDARDLPYEGRLYSSHDGSLTITNVTAKDQGRYMANVYLSNGDMDEHGYTVIILGGNTDSTSSLALICSLVAAVVVTVVAVVAGLALLVISVLYCIRYREKLYEKYDSSLGTQSTLRSLDQEKPLEPLQNES